MGEEVEGGVLLPDQVYQEPSHGGSLLRQAGRGGRGAKRGGEVRRRGGEDSEGYSSESSMGEGRGEREYQREMDLILRQLKGVRRTRRGEFSVKSA